jgi:hypothetical protein
MLVGLRALLFAVGAGSLLLIRELVGVAGGVSLHEVPDRSRIGPGYPQGVPI